MLAVKHVDKYRNIVSYGWFACRDLWNILECSEEQVLDLRFAEGWVSRDEKVRHGLITVDSGQKEYDVASMGYETRCRLASGIISIIEEFDGALLVATSAELSQCGVVLQGVSSEVLQAALYRSRQFQYAALSATDLHLSDYDAIAFVAKGFGIPAHILFDLKDALDQSEYGSFMEMSSNIRLLTLLEHFRKVPVSSLYPEFSKANTLVQ